MILNDYYDDGKQKIVLVFFLILLAFDFIKHFSNHDFITIIITAEKRIQNENQDW